jgi:hypothetical protein
LASADRAALSGEQLTMPKFNVLVTRDTTESTVVDVEADDAEQAKENALHEARLSPENFDWTPDDCMGGEPYLADPDECAQQV